MQTLRFPQIQELRLLAFLIMSIVGCGNPQYATQLFGTVERERGERLLLHCNAWT